MTRDWKAAAAAFAPDIPPEAIERIAGSLDAVEAAFRPQVARITLETEPSFVQLAAREKDA